METKQMVATQEQVSNVDLIRGQFSPEEALDIISALIDQKINFHEVRKFQRWELDHDRGSEDLDQRIKELKQEKKNTKEFLTNFLGSDKVITVSGLLDITVSDPE